MISFMNVHKYILSDVNLHIPKGISVGIIGETGSGKTTFLKLACGLLAPDEGQVYTLGRNPVATTLGTRLICNDLCQEVNDKNHHKFLFCYN